MTDYPASTGAHALRALIVEDDPHDCELLLLYFHRLGITVRHRCVDTLDDMKTALMEEHWDVILSDHRLPRFSSLEALEAAQQFDPILPFIIISGAIGEDAAVEAMQRGAADYLLKGNLSRLAGAVQHSLQNAKMARQAQSVEAALRESEEMFRTLAKTVPVGIYRADREGAWVYVNETLCAMTGMAPAEMLDDGWMNALHPEDFLTVITTLREATAARKPYKLEHRFQRSNGDIVWVLAQSEIPEDRLIGHTGSITDITERKRAETEMMESRQRLRELTSHIEAVKEKERAAIAREIHDDIGGSLTGLKIDLSWLRNRFANDSEVEDKLDAMGRLLDSAFTSSTRIARELRPSALDYGIVAAIEWQATEFKKRMGIPCRFECSEMDIPLESSHAIVVFRIFQEALTNIAKHAGATKVDVNLFASKDELNLEIRDNGKGFSQDALFKQGSFGVIGMKERAEQLGGWLDVSATPGGGVTVMLGIPRLRTCPVKE